MKPLKPSLAKGVVILKQSYQRFAQAGRMMVGVGDYNTYLDHMKHHHPELEPMSSVAYFRYCQEARYPTSSGKITRCPC